MVQNTPYVWFSLILVIMLCLTVFAYTRERPLIRWRGQHGMQNSERDQNQEQERTDVPAAIWMSDIPPSYSFVMETNAAAPTSSQPVTPPPSYGSAIIMFPWIANGQHSPDISRLIENTKFRSISRQVSESSAIYNCSVPLSRQTSRQDGSSPSKHLSAISRQISQATVLSRQISLQENKQNQQQTNNGQLDDQQMDNNSSFYLSVDFEPSSSAGTPLNARQRHQPEVEISSDIDKDVILTININNTTINHSNNNK